MSDRTTTEAEALRAAMDRYRASLADIPVRSLLTDRSGIPGPRANLELAVHFAEEAAERAAVEPAPWWDLCRGLADLSARRAPAGDPAEFVAYCGTVGAAAVACVVGERIAEALELARASAGDPRWRMREAAALALRRLLLGRREPTLAALLRFVDGGRALDMRAVVVAVADPAVLAVPELAEAAVDLHRQVLRRLLAATARDTTATRVLRQALGFSLATLATALPDEGFAMLRGLIETHDPDGVWIVRENLRRAELKRRHPERVIELELLLGR